MPTGFISGGSKRGIKIMDTQKTTNIANSITAIIPVRAGSRRMKNKNIAQFNGTTLLEHKIEVLKKVPEIAKIVVSSDSDYMLELAAEHSVEIHKRPLEYCDEQTKTFGEVVQFVCSAVDGDHILWSPCTSPLIYPTIYSQAINQYFDALQNGYDSLMTVELFKHYLWDENKPLNFKFELHPIC